MTPQETRDFLLLARRQFTAIDEAIAKPATESSAAMAAWEARIDAWKATLALAPYEDALRCLAAIHRGDAGEELRFPSDWRDKFPATVRRWCRDNRLPTMSTAAKYDTREPRYRCADCFDTGRVMAICAAYAHEHRDLVEGDEPIVAPDEPLDYRTNPSLMIRLREWATEARRWCRESKRGPLVAACICHCDAPIAVAQRQAMSERRVLGCVFRPERMPRVEGFGWLSLWEGFARFVATRPAEEAYTWNPSAPLSQQELYP